MEKRVPRWVALLLALGLVAAACGDDGDNGAEAGNSTTVEAAEDAEEPGSDDGEVPGTVEASETEEPEAEDPGGIDYEALGLWDDGPCDPEREPLVLGITTVYESAVLSLVEQVMALEAAAEAFNSRGGANGACIEVHGCDEQSNFDRALECVRELDEAGVVATVNDQTTAALVEVADAMAQANISRVAVTASSATWADQNQYPMDAGGSGVIFMLPQALLQQGTSDIALIRVDLAAAAALSPVMEGIYGPDGVAITADIPVAAGTTDWTQYVIAAEESGAGGIVIAMGEQETVQVLRAGQQLSTDLKIGQSLGTFSYSAVAGMGDFAANMVFVWPFPPATADVPVYEVLRGDLQASGEEIFETEMLKPPAMRSWIGLYALLWMIRDDGMTEFSRDSIEAMLDAAEDVPMLGLYGDEAWTPSLDNPGAWPRTGIDRWVLWTWDPSAEWNDQAGNFVPVGEMSWNDVLCGSAFGAPEPC